MFSYLQPVYPEFSEGFTEARWTLCQTHLDFCFSYFHPHSHPAQLLVNAVETCDFSQIQRGRRKSLEDRSLLHRLSLITNTQMKEEVYFVCLCLCCRTENVTDQSHFIAHACGIEMGAFEYIGSL